MHFNEEEKTNEDATAAKKNEDATAAKKNEDATAAKKNEDATAADATCRVVLDLPSVSDHESSGVMDDKAAESSVRKSSREKHQTEFYGIERSHFLSQNELSYI